MATPKRSPAKKATKSAGAKKGGKAGLIFPVGRVGSLLRRGRYARRVGASSAVYLAAVLEYLTAELLELSSKTLTGSKKRISPRAVTLAVRHDDDLGTLLKDVTLSRGGVIPNVEKALEGKKKHKKSAKKSHKKAKKSSATPKRSPAKKASKSAGAKKGGKAGLIFPVGRIGSLLRKGRYARRVAASSAVYLAAVLEYLTAELLELSSKALTGSKKRISPRAVTLAVRHDDDLGTLLKDVTLSRGGVIPNVEKALEGKKKHKKSSKKHSKKAKKSSGTPKV